MTGNILFIVVVVVLSCAAPIRCLALQQTWEDVLEDTTSDETALYSNKTPNHAAVDAYNNEIHANPEPDPKNGSSIRDEDAAEILARFDHEPSIHEVQKAAVRYAEVHKEKIDGWRRNAKRKALLPKVSVGVDESKGDYYYNGTLRGKDQDTGWDITASWDLGDLIWNNDQNSIDVRSRLMVQLRDDILNNITRLYFERRKLQIDLLINPPKNVQSKLEKELRLQELTAGIDALTGGWFSKMIRKD
ncbi:MAG: hypothetical protein HY589_00980 [Candidatus Omnitrophica bacterium]|nr:hypothetical protein [Candidatus Omnitrophota bacterium]